MMINICTETNPGLVRNNNEDAVASDEETGLCILADGMGGHNAGEIASGMATAFIKSEMRKWISEAGKGTKSAEVETALAQCIAQANHAIFSMSRTNPQYSGMGTTLVVGVFHGDGLVLAHIGDSRCYRLSGGQFRQITKDHSLLQEQADSGLVMPDHMLAQFSQNVVTRALGVEENARAEIHQHHVTPGDIYLMCSDGLSDMVADEAIAAILSGAGTLPERAAQLVVAANAGGGRDNISVLLAEVGDAGGSTGLLSAAKRALRGVLPGRSR
jgi:serine/threonine protein phosphatase PrpC